MPPSRRPQAIRDNSDMTDDGALHVTAAQVAEDFGVAKVRIKQEEFNELKEKAAQAEWLREQLDQALTQQGEGSALAVASDGTMRVHDFQLTPTGMIAPENISSDAWVDMGRLLAKLEGSLQWLIGDWIVYGESIEWGDIPGKAKELGFAVQTLYDYASVSRKVQFSIRIENLSFAHHRLVMAMPPEYQSYALQFAAQERYSVADFRKWIKLGMPENGIPKELPSPIQTASRTPTLKPLSTEFKRLMEWDQRQAERYLDQIEAWTLKMRAELKGGKK